MSGRVYRLVAVVLAAIGLAAIQGCGGSAEEGSTGESAVIVSGPPLLRKAEVRAETAGTPQRAALEWWFAVQQNDPETAAALYAEEPPLPALAGQFNLVGGTLGGSVEIDSVDRSGAEAAVVATQTIPGAKPPERKVRLRLIEEDGAWKLADNLVLDEAVRQVQG